MSPEKEIESWRQFESGVIAEKNAVESLMYMLSGLQSNNSGSYALDKEKQIYNVSREFD